MQVIAAAWHGTAPSFPGRGLLASDFWSFNILTLNILRDACQAG
jgi:hypothetical protein